MEQTPKTSFIPKQGAAAIPSTQRRARSFNLFGFLATILFLGALILSVGAFLYETYTESKLASLKEQLAASRSSFTQSDIESIRELDLRLRTARALVDQHLSVSSLFDMLERHTQQNVEYTSLSYERRSSGNAAVTLGGKSSRFNTVALQGMRFTSEPVFGEHMFSDINIVPDEASGQDFVVFRAYAELDESAIAYNIVPAPADEVMAQPEETAAPAATTTEEEPTDI